MMNTTIIGGTIAANSITANQISVGSIAASQITISDWRKSKTTLRLPEGVKLSDCATVNEITISLMGAANHQPFPFRVVPDLLACISSADTQIDLFVVSGTKTPGYRDTKIVTDIVNKWTADNLVGDHRVTYFAAGQAAFDFEREDDAILFRLRFGVGVNNR